MYRNASIVGQRGASAVEFAIVLPVLLLLLFGTIEFGVLFFDKAVITNASREGARRGVVWWTDSVGTSFAIANVQGPVEDTVDTYCKDYLISFGATSPSPTTTLAQPDSEHLKVTVQYKYDFLIIPNFVTSIVGPLTLEGVTTMRIES